MELGPFGIDSSEVHDGANHGGGQNLRLLQKKIVTMFVSSTKATKWIPNGFQTDSKRIPNGVPSKQP